MSILYRGACMHSKCVNQNEDDQCLSFTPSRLENNQNICDFCNHHESKHPFPLMNPLQGNVRSFQTDTNTSSSFNLKSTISTPLDSNRFVGNSGIYL